jgi:GNAT superfamily N-acetyltransferase
VALGAENEKPAGREHAFLVLGDFRFDLLDAPGLFGLVDNVGELWLDRFKRTLGRFSVLYVCEVDGVIAGFIVARLKRVPEYLGGVMVGELKDMWVEPEVRKLGIGEELLRLAIEWCRAQNAYSCEAQILVGNQPIINLIEYLGMKTELYQFRLNWEDYRPR